MTIALALRSQSAAPLTFAQVDANWTAIQNAINAGTNANNVNYMLAATGAMNRSQASKNSDVISLLDFPVVGDGIHDDTAAVQSAVNRAQATGRRLYVPGTLNSYRLTAPIMITGPINIEGDGFYNRQGGTRTGSWFQLDHLGIGFQCYDPSGTPGVPNGGGYWFSKIATIRNQPVAAPGWTPLAASWDFQFKNLYDVYVRDVMMLNPTLGMQFTASVGGAGSAGRLNVDGLYGQPFNVGLDIETAYDTCTVRGVHFWPYWAEDANAQSYVWTYQMANLAAVKLGRCDNPLIDDCFSIFSQFGFLFYLGANGVTSKAHISNTDVDLFGSNAVAIASNASGVAVQLENFTCQGQTGLTTTTGIFGNAPNVTIVGSNVRITNTYSSAVALEASGCIGKFADLQIENWNLANAGQIAVVATNGATIDISQPIILSGGNGAPVVNDATAITSDQWVSWAPVVSAQSGTITSSSATGTYQHLGSVVSFEVSITITTNGSGADSLKFSLPIAVSTTGPDWYALGRTSIGGPVVVANLDAGLTVATATTYNNLYPGGDGAIIRVSGSYHVD